MAAMLALMALAVPAPALAAELHEYSLSFRGVRAGTITLEADRGNGRFRVTAEVRDSGMLGLIASFGFKGSSVGRIGEGGRLVAEEYSGVAESNDRVRHTRMTFADGRPDSVELTPVPARRPHDIVAAEQAGTVDPVTAALEILGDAPVATACNRSVEIFDGRRRSRIAVEAPQAVDGQWSCAGTYTRVAGFSQKDMDERTTFPFTLFFREEGGVMKATGFEARSIYGNAAAVRR